MMGADLEALVLSGELFDGPPSPDAGWHDDERSAGGDSDAGSNRDWTLDESQEQRSIGMGPGRTGVKGVIRDRNEATSIDRSAREKGIEQLNKDMEKASLGGMTFLEEEREREWEKVLMEGGGDGQRLASQRLDANVNVDVFGRQREGRFGHLREVGVDGFVDAVEQEERGIWVVVHLYEPSLERCCSLDDTLTQLARVHPGTKFLRSRASSLGFASITSPRPKLSSYHFPGHYQDDDDDDDPYADDDDDEGQKPNHSNTVVDTEMLPTMLVYRDGDLVHNWVRVDWEAGPAGIEEWLSKHHILPESMFRTSNLELLSDDDIDDDDDEDDDFELSLSD